MLRIQLPRLSKDKTECDNICKVLQGTPELGFLHRDSIRDSIRENDNRGTVWAAYIDETLVGVGKIGSRRAYPHLTRHGDIAVLPKYRRQRVATALYFAQVLQSLLEGRREVEDTIIPALSPWMVGPTKCGGYGIGFLPSLEYRVYGILPQRTKGFKDIQLWGKPTIETDIYLDRIPKDSTYQLIDTPKMRDTFDKNYKNYQSHDPHLAEKILSLEEWVLNSFDVQHIE